MGYTSRIEKLRTEHRPYLDSWNGEHIYKRFASYRDSLSLRHAKPEDILRPDPAFSNLPGQVPNPSMDATSNVKEPLQTPISPGHDYLKHPPRCLPLCVDRSKLESLDDYKALNLPVLIRNIPQHEDWDCCKVSKLFARFIYLTHVVLTLRLYSSFLVPLRTPAGTSPLSPPPSQKRS